MGHTRVRCPQAALEAAGGDAVNLSGLTVSAGASNSNMPTAINNGGRGVALVDNLVRVAANSWEASTPVSNANTSTAVNQSSAADVENLGTVGGSRWGVPTSTANTSNAVNQWGVPAPGWGNVNPYTG